MKKRYSKKKKLRKIKSRKHKGGQITDINKYTICFVNAHRNGDVYISIQFIIDIMNKCKTNYKYFVVFNKINLENFEMLNIPLDNLSDNSQYDLHNFITIKDDTKEIIVNTWVGLFKNFEGKLDINLPFYYETFKELYSILKIKMEDLDYYIPSFNQASFTKYQDKLKIVEDIYSKIPKRKVLICNGRAISESSDFNQDIISLFLNNNFFVKVTNKDSITDPNIIDLYNKNINEYNNDIMTNDNLLYINQIIASKSDFVLGATSGLFYTTFSKESLNTKFILIGCLPHILYDKFNMTFIDEKDPNIINSILELIKV